MWESRRTYLSFVLVGAIFIVCHALSGGAPGRQAPGASNDPGDRTHRLRDETSGRAGRTSSGGPLLMTFAPSRLTLGEDRRTQ